MSSLRLALKQSLEEAGPSIQNKAEPKQRSFNANERKRKRKLTKGGSRARSRDLSKKRKRTRTGISLMREIISSASFGTESHERRGGKSSARSNISGHSSSNDTDASDDDRTSESSSDESSSDDSSGTDDSDSDDSGSSSSSSGSDGQDSESVSDKDGHSSEDMEGVFDSEGSSDDEKFNSRKEIKLSKRYRNHHERYSEDSEEGSFDVAAHVSQRTKLDKKQPRRSSSPSSLHSRSRQQSPPPNESQSYRQLSSSSSASQKKRLPYSSAQSIASSSSKKDKRSSSSVVSSKKKGTSSLKNKNVRKQKTVPAPNPHVLAWVMGMSEEKQRRKISPGMRVKVRFVNPSLQWYGGVITAVSSKGDRVKIKYDDGTKEKARFPDKEIIVDADGNGEHSSDVQILVQAFRPKVVGPPLGNVALSIKKKKKKKLQKKDPSVDVGEKQIDNISKVNNESNSNKEEISMGSKTDKAGKRNNDIVLPGTQNEFLADKKETSNVIHIGKIKKPEELLSNPQPSATRNKVMLSPKPSKPTTTTTIPEAVSNLNPQSLSENSNLQSLSENSNLQSLSEKRDEIKDEVNDNGVESENMAVVTTIRHVTMEQKNSGAPKHSLTIENPTMATSKTPVSAKTSSPVTSGDNLPSESVLDSNISSKIDTPISPVQPKIGMNKISESSIDAVVSNTNISSSESKPKDGSTLQPAASDTAASGSITCGEEDKPDQVPTEEMTDHEAVSEEDDSMNQSPWQREKASQKIITSGEERIGGETKIKKRRKDKEGDKKGKDKSQEDVEDWVQCDICSKWRLIPSVKDLPEKWYCELNVTDPKRNFCAAPEQTLEEVAKQRRKAKKASRKAANSRATSPAAVPKSQKIKEGVEDASEKKKSSPNLLSKSISEDTIDNTDSAVKKRKNKSDASLEDENSDNEPSVQTRRVKRGRKSNEEKAEGRSKRGRKPKEEKQQEWVQCEKCEKWRRLPRHISAKDLPDQWYCSMNDWDPRSASCAVQEDYKIEEEKLKENTILTGNGQGASAGGSKLTYRNLIRRPTRPISERMRAAESIFSSHAAEPDGEQSGNPPVVLYSQSSMFQQRPPHHNRLASNQENQSSGALSLFDLMHHSQLWKSLYSGLCPTNNRHCSSNTDGSIVSGSNNDDMDEIKSMVYYAMGTREMATSDILLECQCREWDHNKWTNLRATVSHEDIVTAIEELIKDGKVQEISPDVQTNNDDGMSDDYTATRYKRCQMRVSDQDTSVSLVGQESHRDSLQSRYGSRALKFSKPWKRVEDRFHKNDGWIHS